jgi:hypothetical protein
VDSVGRDEKSNPGSTFYVLLPINPSSHLVQ